ncbi:P-loop containing nucleoside triphosphate hydrolase protein [Filobasidium floriforme]|uniref:P-loop containing nucleoside triphosphate hydrolase protein n=1 Tax=Filobasidium floriforme TaxID=5210 RepID=UPI001E8DE539|nr:P-loop containing nucleoside triphosphate hydrolase protein [Filobasidium floriforme]KAH8083503.1 P-loop containing nucleoside triphosphate hydrolase protein [Filobasidium floriforme]
MIDSKDGGKWTQVALRSKRPIASVITSNNIAEDVAKDMREFLDSESWYTNRGIPWRRGYLLYGAAGAGKTSLIHACASALDLEVYCITLATEGLTDAILLKAMTLIPPGGVVVMEDVDVAIPKTSNEGLNRDDAPVKKEEENRKKGDRGSSGGHITLSGLLNAIDGISGSDGRLLFMTTNKKEMLDEALIRPGRADLSFEFFKATSDQIERMFKAFFPVDEIIKANSSHADTDSGDEEDEKSIWTDEYIEELAKLYSAKVPKDFLSTAAVQGHLMVHKNSPRTAVGTIGEYIEKKHAEIAKAEEEKAKKEAEEKGDETKEDKEKAEEKKKDDSEDRQVKEEAIKLAAAAIIGLVTKALEKPEETEKSEEEAKIEVEKADGKRVEEERKADDLAVEVEGC